MNLAPKILLHDKLRFLITVAGVGFAVALVLVQSGLFLGLMDNASTTIDHVDADLWITAKATPNLDFTNGFPETLVQRVRSAPGVSRADNLIVWFIRVALPSGAREGVQVYAMEDFARWNLPWRLVEGDVTDLRRGSHVIIDDSATRRFGAFEVGQWREFLGKRMKIIGRSQGAVSFTTTPIAFMDHRTMQSLCPELAGRTTYVVVRLREGADAHAVADELRRRLPHNDVHMRLAWAGLSRQYWVQSTGLGLNLATTVFLGCLVGVVVVAQTLYASTMEHLREFGTIKAIGGGNWDIYKVLLQQAAIAAVAGFALGAGLALAARPALAQLDLKLIIPRQSWGLVFIGTLALCLASAAVSFRRVARLDPAMVFRG